MSEVASTLVVGVIFVFYRWFLVEENDTQIIRTFMEHQWQRNLSPDPQPLLS